jgi:hypothetical protein
LVETLAEEDTPVSCNYWTVFSVKLTAVLGPEVDRPATLHTNARTDLELLAVWLKSHANGSPHTVRVYQRVGERFLGALADPGGANATG